MLSEKTLSSPEHVEDTTTAVDDVFTDTTLDELNIAMADLENMDQVISEAVETSSELMEEEDAVERVQQQQQEGVSQVALEALQRNVNSLLKQVGFVEKVDFLQNTYNNKRHNKLALESAADSIKEFIAKIWEAIKIAISKTTEMVKSLLKHFFDAALKIKRQCLAIKEVAKANEGKTHGSTDKVGGFTISRYARFNNKSLEPSDVLLNFNKWTTHNYNFIEAIAGKAAIEEYTGYVRKSSTFFASTISGEHDLNEVKRETDALGDLMISRIVSKFEIHKGGVHTTKPYIGDVCYQFDEANLGFTIVEISDYKNLPTEKTHTPFNTRQTIELCDKIIAHMKEYDNLASHLDALTKLSNSVSTIASSAISDDTRLDLVQRKSVSNSTSFMIKVFIRAIRNVGIGARQYDLNVCRALTQWCSISMGTL